MAWLGAAVLLGAAGHAAALAWVEAAGAGDADGDGRDDLLLLQRSEATSDVELRTMSGETLWRRTFEPPASPFVDLDGDGVVDLLQEHPEDNGTTARSRLGTAETVRWKEVRTTWISGASGATLQETVRREVRTLSAPGDPARASGSSFDDHVHLLVPGVLAHVNATYAYQAAGGAAAVATHGDVRVRFLEPDGTHSSAVTVADPAVVEQPAGWLLAEGGDPVLLVRESVASGSQALSAWSRDGQRLWRHTLPPAAAGGLSGAAANLGDVDGDGWTDAGVALLSGNTTVLVVVSGADGAELARRPGVLVRPFGDIDGDGSDELLDIPEGDGQAGVRDGDLSMVWTKAVRDHLAPTDGDPYMAHPQRHPDRDGDGSPDLLGLRETALRTHRVVLLDGRDGSTAWETVVGDVDDVQRFPEVTGVGEGDVLAVRSPPGPARGSTTGFRILGGENGEVALDKVLYGQGAADVPSDTFTLHIDVKAVGDHDGDGRADLFVTVNEGLSQDDPSHRRLSHTVRSSATGEVVLALDPVDPDGQRGSPGMAWPWLAAGLAAAARRTRRHLER